MFYDNLEGLSDSVQRADYETAEQQLAEVSAFYEGSRAWGVQQLVDSYLFQDAFLPPLQLLLSDHYHQHLSCFPLTQN